MQVTGDAMTEERLEYYTLPDDPVTALNVLRAAAGLEPLVEQEDAD